MRARIRLLTIPVAVLLGSAAVLARAEALATGRNAAVDDAALAVFGEIDPLDWSAEAVRALTAVQWNVAI